MPGQAANKVARSPADSSAWPASWYLAAYRCDQCAQYSVANMCERLAGRGLIASARLQLPTEVRKIADIDAVDMFYDLGHVPPAAARALPESLPGRRLHSLIKRQPAGLQYVLPLLELGRIYRLRVTG